MSKKIVRSIPRKIVQRANKKLGLKTVYEDYPMEYFVNQYIFCPEYWGNRLPLDFLEKLKDSSEYQEYLGWKHKVTSEDTYSIKHFYDSPEYKTYIKSAKWKKLREKILADRKVCEKCGSSKDLHVHHLRYKNFGHETGEDLQVLCHECHCKVHGRRF